MKIAQDPGSLCQWDPRPAMCKYLLTASHCTKWRTSPAITVQAESHVTMRTTSPLPCTSHEPVHATARSSQARGTDLEVLHAPPGGRSFGHSDIRAWQPLAFYNIDWRPSMRNSVRPVPATPEGPQTRHALGARCCKSPRCTSHEPRLAVQAAIPTTPHELQALPSHVSPSLPHRTSHESCHVRGRDWKVLHHRPVTGCWSSHC